MQDACEEFDTLALAEIKMVHSFAANFKNR